jgi:hypothetical protein
MVGKVDFLMLRCKQKVFSVFNLKEVSTALCLRQSSVGSLLLALVDKYVVTNKSCRFYNVISGKKNYWCGGSDGDVIFQMCLSGGTKESRNMKVVNMGF